MRPRLLNLAHLVVIAAAAGIALGSPLAFLTRTNATYAQTNDQLGAVSSAGADTRSAERRNGFTSTWTKILQNPPDSLGVGVGSRVELQCEVAGNPPPQVYWISGNEPERQIQELTLRAQEASNTVPMDWEGVSRVTSTYVIDCVRAEDQGLKYCVSVSNNIVAQSTATVLLVDTTRTTKCSTESQPTVTLHSSWRFALQETTVILPCRAVGQPKPYLFWLDSLGNTIASTTNARYTVLPSGDLQITDLEWADMGVYTCKVQAGNTEKSVSTFLYPVRPESEVRQPDNLV